VKIYLSGSGIASGLAGSTGLEIAFAPSVNPCLSLSSVKSFPVLKLPFPILRLTYPSFPLNPGKLGSLPKNK
jgi:hypothetical protein